MFNKLKQFKDLRSQAKMLQNALSEESVTVEKGSVKVTMNGNLEVVSLEIDENKELARTVRDCINDAVKKTQQKAAQKIRDMGGLPDLKF